MLRVWSSISSSFSVGERSSKCLEKSLSVVWLTQDVIFVLLFAVSSATTSFVGAMCELSVGCWRSSATLVSVLNLRHLDVLVHLIVHFSDGSMVFVWTRIHLVIHVTQKRSNRLQTQGRSSHRHRFRTTAAFPGLSGP